MVQWRSYFGFIHSDVHNWNEIKQFIAGSSNIATSEITSATEYPIFFLLGVRRQRLLWPWACGTRQEALDLVNELASFMGKTTSDSSMKATWSTPQQEHNLFGKFGN